MAPSREYALATVFSTQVRSHDDSSILVEAGGYTPMRWYLEHANQDEESAQPPKKRRKIEVEPNVSRSERAPSSIPISAVTIDLVFPETFSGKIPNEKAIEEDLEFDDLDGTSVITYAISTNDDGSKLRLSLPKPRAPILIIDCDHIRNEGLEKLRHIALLDRLNVTQAYVREKAHPATILSCTLKRSTGEHYTVVRLQATLSWRDGYSAYPQGGRPMGTPVFRDYEYLIDTFPNNHREGYDHSQGWTPQDFYESVHATSNDEVTDATYDSVLESELYPFQKRAVKWMLAREDTMQSPRDGGTTFSTLATDLDGNACYVDHMQGIVFAHPPLDGEQSVSGGILAEEMGLGKTVELMALISLNSRPKLTTTKVSKGPDLVMDNYSGNMVMPSRATLIITPASILPQWQTELNRHAPNLSVFHYQGITADKKKSPSADAILRDLATKYDVVLSTYHTLAREVHFAEEPPDRNMRHQRKFERKRSPLVQIEWWRICLDEAQMVESGVTAAARVACRLPRIHSWAVTGTPLRKDIQDLLGLLIFLRYKPFDDVSSGRLWGHLVRSHRHLFRKLFGAIALRHTKAQIRDELHLPAQKRVVVTVPFSVVEQQNYTTLFNEMCEEVGVNEDGTPAVEFWNPSEPAVIEKMRTYLSRLRQTCLHPQVGGKNRRALGKGAAPLRTVAEVLEVMIEQNETNIRVEERTLIAASLQHAHILGNNEEDVRRSEKALAIYEQVLQSCTEMVKSAREQLAAALSAADVSEDKIDSDEEASSESTPLLGRLKNNLRIALQLQHASTFFAATMYFQIKTNEALTLEGSDDFKKLEEKESSFYEDAKLLRKEILSENSKKAESLMQKIRDLSNRQTITKMPTIKDLQSLGGIESRRIVEKSDALFDVIRELNGVLKDWRTRMAALLLKPLVDEEADKEIVGDEYEDSTKQQDELYVYFDAFKAVHADLNALVTGESAPLIDHEAKLYLKNCKAYFNPDFADEDKPHIHAPELGQKLFTIRKKFRDQREQVGSVRGLIQEARTLESSMHANEPGTRVGTEYAIVQRHLHSLQAVYSSYMKALSGLEKEVELFRTTQNQRVEFYRQLQELSDDVGPYKEELDKELDMHALDSALQKEKQSTKLLAQLKTKNRFLVHLRDDESGAQGGPKVCIICTSTFEQGVLTVCGHSFCKECIQQWFSQARSCPMCKRKLSSADLHDITFRPQQLRAQEEHQPGGSSNSPTKASSSSSRENGTPAQATGIYTDVSPTLLEEIKSIDLPNSYGTKIDTLGRHLHWIREHDPGAKSIVFSQYREFLDVLGIALRDFKLGHARLGRPGAAEKFKHDPSIDCLLLDAKTDSSGLTLVNATHVFICEPLIQTAVELQAIARVHRIGQTRPTMVWMYLINDTVEEAIYEISVQRRLAHVQGRSKSKKTSREATPGAAQESAIEVANSEELQSAPLSKLLVAGKSGGEVVGTHDLWKCLFGKTGAGNSEAAQGEVGRFLRAEAAEERRNEDREAARAGAVDRSRG
ncbi:unnamed protein product [Zymoseptoria tritici ST99CH_1A5]|nr:unnamed protein product [Zymoseptoria tritici ST99CH_1E4]SMY26130.1 unnamed protein product [Zymoseptoria tritici ST99CH_1A5]